MRVLVIAAHPDDVEPQMAGTIAKHVQSGHQVFIVQVTSPTINSNREIRKREAMEAAHLLGAKIKFLDYDCKELKFDRTLINDIEEIFKEVNPNRIYTCWDGDSHQDHQAVSKAVLSVTRENNCEVLFFEPIIPCGLTDKAFKANYFVDISEYIEIKEQSIKAYESQIGKYGPHWLEAISSRAQYNGFRVKVKYAEAFQIIKFFTWS
ncbi:PIG-L deacetylase family protein [Bacillus toyonensis]|uniref:PIG-L deacetylase family protein n=1 Tax=Bacillus cereus group TaxID=86661 RepID=UPI003465F272